MHNFILVTFAPFLYKPLTKLFSNIDEDINLNRVKDTLQKKLVKLNKEIDKINQRLANKNFVEKAPTELIDQEKTNFNNLEKDAKKIQLPLENL